MELKNIQLVSRYEVKLICRSFVFGILCFIAVGGVTFLQYVVQCSQDFWCILTFWDWLMHHQSFSFPQVHAYLFNIVQAFVLIFVVTEVFAREQKQGPLEALYAHPISNSEYFLGKVAAVLLVFFLVGGISMLISCGLNIWGADFAPFNFLYYLYYFLTLTFPSLVFFTGFALWLTWIVRSRVLAMLLLLVYFYFSVIRLPSVFYGLFDFTGSGLSNVFSVATGHVDGWNYVLHRLSYLLAGIGFMFWTVRLQKRIPNNRRGMAISCYIGIGVLFVCVLLGSWFIFGFAQEERVREEYRVTFTRYEEIPSCRVTSHDIQILQRGNQIQATSELVVRNPNGKDLSRFILYLNPGLEVESLEENGEAVRFTRDCQVISVERLLGANDSVKLTVRYGGELDGRVCYLDVDDASYYDTRRGNGFFHLGRRHVLVSDASVVLIPEVMWYPMAVSPVNPSYPALTEREYTRYRLRVVDPVQSVVLSQGEENHRGDTIEFRPGSPLEGISLCAGEYEQKSVLLGGIRVEWYHFKGNDFFSPFVKDLDKKELADAFVENIINQSGMGQPSDRLASVMMRHDWLNGENSRLLLVEAPLPFVSHFRTWKGRSECVQPGLVFLGERGAGMFIENYPMYLRNKEKYGDLWTDCSYIKQPFFMVWNHVRQHPFLQLFSLYEPYTNISEIFNPYNIRSLFFEPAVTITSSRYGMIDQALKLIVANKGRLSRNTGGLGESDVEAFTYLQEHTLEEASHDRNVSSYLLNKMLYLKTIDLLDRIARQVDESDFLDFLTSFYSEHHGEVLLDTLCSDLQTELGIDLDSVLRAWSSMMMTSYQVQDLRLEQIENTYIYVANFRIRNTGKYPGQIMVTGVSVKNYLELQPEECKQVRWQMDGNGFFFDLGLSRNIPTSIGIIGIDNVVYTQDTNIGVWDIPVSAFEIPINEIIVDNEDPGFRLINPLNKKLRNYFLEEQPYMDSYQGDVPIMLRWGKVYNFNCYGLEKRTAYMKTSGKGNFKAEWSADIPEDGTYEIFAMHPKATRYPPKTLYYTVSGEGKEAEEILLDYKNGEWTSLGYFDLKRGKSFVVLDDRAPIEKEENLVIGKNKIIADAVKWVKVN